MSFSRTNAINVIFPGDWEAFTAMCAEGGRDGAFGPEERDLQRGHGQREPLPHPPAHLLPHHRRAEPAAPMGRQGSDPATVLRSLQSLTSIKLFINSKTDVHEFRSVRPTINPFQTEIQK